MYTPVQGLNKMKYQENSRIRESKILSEKRRGKIRSKTRCSTTHLKLDPAVTAALPGAGTSLQHVLHAGVRQTEEPKTSVTDVIHLAAAGMRRAALRQVILVFGTVCPHIIEAYISIN